MRANDGQCVLSGIGSTVGLAQPREKLCGRTASRWDDPKCRPSHSNLRKDAALQAGVHSHDRRKKVFWVLCVVLAWPFKAAHTTADPKSTPGPRHSPRS